MVRISVHEHYFELEINQRNYIAVIITFLAFIILQISPLPSFGLQRPLLYLFLATWSFSIVYDLLVLYGKYKENPLAKATSLIVYTLCTTAALALSCQIVNSIVGINPSKFPYTIAFLAICTIPMFLVIVFSILSIVFLFIFSLYMSLIVGGKEIQSSTPFILPWLKPTKDIHYKNPTRLFQVFSFFLYFGFIFKASNIYVKSYDKFIFETGSYVIYNYEMYKYSFCKTKDGEHIAFLDDNKILIGTKIKEVTKTKEDNYTYKFKVQECEAVPAKL